MRIDSGVARRHAKYPSTKADIQQIVVHHRLSNVQKIAAIKQIIEARPAAQFSDAELLDALKHLITRARRQIELREGRPGARARPGAAHRAPRRRPTPSSS